MIPVSLYWFGSVDSHDLEHDIKLHAIPNVGDIIHYKWHDNEHFVKVKEIVYYDLKQCACKIEVFEICMECREILPYHRYACKFESNLGQVASAMAQELE